MGLSAPLVALKGLGPNGLLEVSEVVMSLAAAVVLSGIPTVLGGAAVFLLASLALIDVVVALLKILIPTDFGPPERVSEQLGLAALLPSTGL